MLFRDDPIIFGRPSIKPPSSQAGTQGLMRSALIWNQLEAAGIPSVKGVWLHDAAGGNLFSVICIAQKYAGHAMQAAIVASQCGGGIRNGRFVVVVDDDINPSDIYDVLWAVSTRCDPAPPFRRSAALLAARLIQEYFRAKCTAHV
jgi:UbiD family decarboxylase